MARDWHSWHREYDDPGSRLSRRLAAVQQFIRAALDRMPAGPIRALSVCAGEGRDLLGVLADHPRAADVTGRLVELDSALAGRAAAHAPPGIEVVCGDASTTSAYAGAVPADLVLVCGVFGNVTDGDIQRTVGSLATLCAQRGVVIWTRHRNPPDRTADIRRWFAEAGFDELGFVGPDDLRFGVGSHRLTAGPLPYVPDVRLFSFIASDARG